MRAVLTNLGSTGDIQPLVALAVELQRHGHRPILALAPYFAAYAKQLGLDFVSIGPDLDYPELQRRETRAVMSGRNHLDLLPDSLAILKSMLPQLFEELYDVCSQADVLISGKLQVVSRMIHDLTQIPFVSVQTNHFGGKQPLVVREAIAQSVNPFRERYGLGPLDDPIHTGANSPQLALYAISRYFRPPAADWPDHHHVTGFFFLDEESREPDASLVEFLEAGPQPVVFSFSSVAHDKPDELTELLVEAVRIAGCRAIIQRGWSGLAKGRTPPDIHALDFLQHSWLFRRSACVVHHGGSGTTAAAIQAGAPAVIVPHLGDQPIWAELARDLGCAGFVIPFQELNAERLGEAISATLNTERFYRNTALIGDRIRAERGVQKARYLIEQMVEKTWRREVEGAHADQAHAIQDGSRGASHERSNRRKQYQQKQRFRRRSSND
jgi:UDP:flavonoid glycosyltransferase YjiC (YdhE family)